MDKAVRLAWVVADQAIFALSNFVLNVQFARWLSPYDYGMFAISFSGFLLLAVVYNACLVVSPGTEADRRRAYVMALVRLHLLLLGGTACVCSLAFLVARSLGQIDVGWLLIGAGIGGMASLILLTTRRLCLVFLSTRTSVLVGILYFFVVIGTGYACVRLWEISWFETWEIMGGWALICSAIIVSLLSRRLQGDRPFRMAEILKFQRRYAPLALIAGLGAWVTSESIFIVLARVGGLEAVAETRVVFNLGNPLIQLTIAVNAFSLIGFSARHARRERHGIVGEILPYLVICALAAAFLGIAGYPAIDFLYRGKYVSVAWELPIFCGSVGMAGLMQIFANLFKARGSLLRGNLPQILSGVATLTFSFQFISMFGQPGAVYANFIGNAVGLAIGLLLFVSQEPLAKPITSRRGA